MLQLSVELDMSQRRNRRTPAGGINILKCALLSATLHDTAVSPRLSATTEYRTAVGGEPARANGTLIAQ